MIHGKCTLSLMSLYATCLANNVRVDMRIILNDSLITRARNLLVHWFMQTDCTHLLFIDADIEFKPEDILKMLATGAGVIGGLYAKKEIDWNHVRTCAQKVPDCNLLVNGINPVIIRASGEPANEVDAPVEVMRVGTGLMLIRREVFELMRKKYGDQSELYDQQQERGIYCYFDCRLDGREFLSEDWFFCKRWTDMGGKVYAAPWTRTTHYGSFGFPIDMKQVHSVAEKLQQT